MDRFLQPVRQICWASLLALLSLPSFAESKVFAENKVFQTELANGMKVLVKTDTRAPIVVHQVWYRVGAVDEPNGLTGISHMLEHMMFKGTEKYKPGEFSKIVSQLGGSENAFTSSDYTAYYQVVAKEYLPQVMAMEADRMRNLRLSEQEFQSERNVVKQERLWRTDDKPSAKLFEQFNALSFINSPRRNPVIGWMNDIENYELADLQAWYQKWYAPNNATLVVVGDVEPDEVVKLAKQTYGVYQARELAVTKPQIEIAQQGERRLVLKDAVPTASILLGFPAPGLVGADEKTAKEFYALNLLAEILDGDESSRLNQALVRDKQLASSVGAFYRGLSRSGGQFIFSAKPAGKTTVSELETAIWQQIEELKTKPIKPEELQRVLAKAEAQYVYRQDSVQSQANTLGSLASVGLSVDLIENWVENLRQVTPEQIQAVAQKYLLPDAMTVAILQPNGESNRAPAARPNFQGRNH